MDSVDRGLLARVAAGDHTAFEELYLRHAQALLAYAEGLLADRGHAEEALQDTFLAVWRGARDFQGRSTVRTWLFGICRRQALRRVPQRPAHVPVDQVAEVVDQVPGPEAVALARADVATIVAAIGELPPYHRDVLHLTFGAGLSQEDVADVLGIPVGTVKSRLFHARASLARALAEEAPYAEEAADRRAARAGGDPAEHTDRRPHRSTGTARSGGSRSSGGSRTAWVEPAWERA